MALPDVRGRKAILDHYMTTIAAARDDDGNILIDTDTMARSTPGASGADLANMVNAAALSHPSFGGGGGGLRGLSRTAASLRIWSTTTL